MRESSGAALTLLTAHLPDPGNYGRIVRDRNGGVAAIVEQKDLEPDQHHITEVNTGTYCFDAAVLFAHLDRLTTENAQGEYYLTDMVEVFNDEGLLVSATHRRGAVRDARRELTRAARRGEQGAAAAHQPGAHARRRHDDRPRSRVGRPARHARARRRADADDVPARRDHGGRRQRHRPEHPGRRLDGGSLGADRRVGRARGDDRRRGDRGPVSVHPAGDGPQGASAKAGHAVEIKNSTIGEDSKVPHLSYIGDADARRRA